MSTILHSHEQLMDLQDAIVNDQMNPKRTKITGHIQAFMEIGKKKAKNILRPMPRKKQDLFVPFAI